MLAVLAFLTALASITNTVCEAVGPPGPLSDGQATAEVPTLRPEDSPALLYSIVFSTSELSAQLTSQNKLPPDCQNQAQLPAGKKN